MFWTFAAAYTLNLTWISVFYHRGLCHGALRLSPRMRRFVVASGPWIVGIDAKAWVCMHRLHHLHSDTARDPHSPGNDGILGVARAQLFNYRRVLARLIAGQPKALAEVGDLDFPVHGLYEKRMWWAPYAVHLALALGLAMTAGWWIGLAFLAGISSHPIQGWMVNSLAHRFGGRRHKTDDDSRNNLLVALLCFGEGLQNNHHAFPGDAKFSQRPWEVDAGWWLCRALSAAGVVTLAEGGRRG